jgi:hypothetical protein
VSFIAARSSLDKFYKGRSQEKTHPLAAGSFLASQPT